jgi:hypothetical protein
MDIKIVLDTRGAAAAGVDQKALIADIQAELDKLPHEEKSKKPPVAEPAPKNAQGDPTAFHWLLHIATDPAMAKVYAQGLAFAINSLLSSAQRKKATKNDDEAPAKDASAGPGIVNITAFGKELLLPATTVAVQAWLQSLGGNQ